MSPKNVARPVVPAIDLYCRKASFKTIKFLSMILCSKKDLFERKTPARNFLIARCAVFEKLRTRLAGEGKINLFSVHLKINSFSFCKMTVDDQFNTSLVNWQKIPFDHKFMPGVKRHVSLLPGDTLCKAERIVSLLGISPKMTNFVSIERDRTQSREFDCKLHINILEHLLYAKCQGVRLSPTGEESFLLAAICNSEFVDAFWSQLTPIRNSLKEHPSVADPLGFQICDPLIRAAIKNIVTKRLLRSAFDNDTDPLMGLRLDSSWKSNLPALSSTTNLDFSLKDCLNLDTEEDARDMAHVFLTTMALSKSLCTYASLADIVMNDKGRFNSNILKEFNELIKQERGNLQNFQAASSEFLKDVKL
ncbi:mrs1p [Saccharomyces arboricola H-6]|uniref:Mrs1p n=1 Tax=Saccharomyces arboricola (strain H-6 / AS 2.3317 / CBS 10644) TaxID=1160507 RepID=J8LMC9_SACAR|nr:mrs1p [Saccharomyces arboricola H-6]